MATWSWQLGNGDLATLIRVIQNLKFGKMGLANRKIQLEKIAKQGNTNVEFDNLSKWTWETCKNALDKIVFHIWVLFGVVYIFSFKGSM